MSDGAWRAPSTRVVLLVLLLPIIFTLTGVSLLLIWHGIRQQVTMDVSTDLQRSVHAFQNAEAERFSALQREAALLADLPSLKALLTTNDDRTIQNAASDFWRTSGNGLFALAGPDDRIRAVNTAYDQDREALAGDLSEALQHPEHGYLLSRGHLLRYAVSRVYFGDKASGTMLGTVISGYEINSSYLAELNSAVDAQAAFVSRGVLIGSSLQVQDEKALSHLLPTERPLQLSLNHERYLAISEDLSARGNAPLSVIFYRSLRPAEVEVKGISRQLILLGVSVVFLGSLLVIIVARRLTKPLEDLARCVRAFGEGKAQALSAAEGKTEIRQLALNFQAMQTRVEDSSRAQLESERLATIGSMATSVSHDLRHHLASIYANAEFLAAPELSEEERAEFFADIQAAVLETTDMLESLTIFSRTGQAARHMPEEMGVLLERAVAQLRMHPAAASVTLRVLHAATNAPVDADGKQIQRALFNLLLNACQSRRPVDRPYIVTAVLQEESKSVCISIFDNGAGIPPSVQHTLFEPFVSSGKQNGTGLGLTLARRIAEDHRGNVCLLCSNSEETVFQLCLPLSQGKHTQAVSAVSQSNA